MSQAADFVMVLNLVIDAYGNTGDSSVERSNGIVTITFDDGSKADFTEPKAFPAPEAVSEEV